MDRDKRGRFKKGNKRSRGRPRGALNKSTMAVQQLLEGEAEAIARQVVNKAKGGDLVAAGMVLRALMPAKRVVRFDLGPLESAADVPAAIARLLQAVAAGALTPDEALSIGSLFENFSTAFSVAELERRVEELEAAHTPGA